MRRLTFIPPEMKQLGKYLRALRKELGLSIRASSAQTSISPSYLSKLEAGDTFQTINTDVLVRLANFYKIPPEVMLKEIGLTKYHNDPLPDFSEYLRQKYQLSPQAIRDMEMAKEIVDKKYGGKYGIK